MPNLFTNIRDRGRGFVDRDGSGGVSRNEWLGAGARTAMMGPVGVGVNILGGAIADTIAQSDWGNRAGNWLTRQATRAGLGPAQVGPPEAERQPNSPRREARRSDPIFSDSSESEEARPQRNRNQRATTGTARGTRGWVPGATAVVTLGGGGPLAAYNRQHLISGGYGTGGLLGLGNRQVLGQSSLNMRNPTVSNQVR